MIADTPGQISSGPTRLTSLDALRGFAALGTMCVHIGVINNVRPMFFFLRLSLAELFYTLSGFLVTSQLLRLIQQRGGFSFWWFLPKCMMRLYPLYLVVLVAQFIIAGADFFTGKFWLHLFAIQNLFPEQFTFFRYSWSVCVEWHFYFAIAAVTIGLGKLRRIWLFPFVCIAILLFGPFWRAHIWWSIFPDGVSSLQPFLERIYWATHTNMDGFALGSLIAYAMVFHQTIMRKWLAHKYLWFSLACGLVAASLFLFKNEQKFYEASFGISVWTLAYGSVLLYCLSHSKALSSLTFFRLNKLGEMALTVYLVHPFAMNAANSLATMTGWQHPLFLVVADLTVGIPLCYLAYTLVEKPFLQRRRRWLRSAHALPYNMAPTPA